MSGSKYYVYGGRWRELDASSGFVAGWTRKAKFVYMKRGRLRVAKRRRVLSALQALAGMQPSAISLGARLSALSKESLERMSEKIRQTNVSSVTQPAQCVQCSCAQFAQPALHGPCVNQQKFSHCIWCNKDFNMKHPLSEVTSAKPMTEICPTSENQKLTINITNTKTNQQTQDELRSLDINKSNNIDKKTMKSHGFDSLLKENRINNSKRDHTESDDLEISKKNLPTRESGNSRKSKRKKKEKENTNGTNNDEESDNEYCKELTIPDSDVRALRTYVAKARKDALKRFDTDDDYKLELFYAINPLVNVERCPLTERAIRERLPMALAPFAARLGLTPSPGPAGDSIHKPSKSRRVRHENIQQQYEDESYSDDDIFQNSRLIKRNKVVNLNKGAVDSENKKKNENKQKETIAAKSRDIKKAPIKCSIQNSHTDFKNKMNVINVDERTTRRASFRKPMSRSSSEDSDNNVRNNFLNNKDSLLKGVKVRKRNDTENDSGKDHKTGRNFKRTPTTKRSEVDTDSTSSDNSSEVSIGIKRRSLRKSIDLNRNSQEDSHNRRHIALRRNISNNSVTENDTSDTDDDSTDSDRPDDIVRKKYGLRKHNSQDTDNDDVIKNKSIDAKSVLTRSKPNVPSSNSSETDVNRSTVVQKRRIGNDVINRSRKTNRDDGVSKAKTNKTDSESEHVENKRHSLRSSAQTQANTSRQQANSKDESKLTKSNKSAEDKIQSTLKESTVSINKTKSSKHPTLTERKIRLRRKSDKRNDSSNESDHFKSVKSKPDNKMGKDTEKHVTNKSPDKEAHVISKRGGVKEYSNLEDHAIVAWVSTGGRARKVNGNRLWKELAAEYCRLTGVERSWHSVRNRYLRYVLPGLGALGLAPPHAARLRAAAAAGELKSKRSGVAVPRRNSIFDERRVQAASRRAPPPPPPAPRTPRSPAGDDSTRRRTRNSAGPNNSVVESPLVKGRSSRTSVRARRHEESESADGSSNEAHQPARSPAHTVAGPKSRTRKLFNPKLVL